MKPAWVNDVLAKPGLYAIGMPGGEVVLSLVLSRDGKLYSLALDNELAPDRFNEGAFIQKTLLEGNLSMIESHPEDAQIIRLKRGECIKCGMGPMRESCAYPEACEHPGRELAKRLNQCYIALAELAHGR